MTMIMIMLREAIHHRAAMPMGRELRRCNATVCAPQVSSSAALDVHYAVNPVSARVSPTKPLPHSPQPFLV